MRIILASSSPRRRDLLGMLGVRDLVIAPADGEPGLPDTEPHDAVITVAAYKARRAYDPRYYDDVLIAADTAVYLDGRALGKPEDSDEARKMLRLLSGREHTVYTGVAVVYKGREYTAFEKTKVRFRDISDDEIAAYVQTGEPMDKAGAYGAQGRGAVFIEGIEGDFFNVVGLPLCRLDRILREIGVRL